MSKAETHTVQVGDEIFHQVYESPASLPGRHRWLTPDKDVRKVEELLGIRPGTIGAPLWVSGDRKRCPSCDRETNWLDIVSSGLGQAHKSTMIVRVILGDQKYINTEAPRAISNLHCFQCHEAIDGIRSFKCHNWAYASPELLEVLQEIERNAEVG